MNDGNTVAGYIPFDPILSNAPMENEPMNPTDMNEAEMNAFFAKVASAVVNASEQAKVIEAIRAQQVEDHARLHNLESLVSTHLQTIDALREAVRVTSEERNKANANCDGLARDYQEARATIATLCNERDMARNERDAADYMVRELETEITNLLARNTERGATIHEHETTIHELRQQLHDANMQCDSLYRDNDKFAARIHELEDQAIVATHLNTNQAVSIENYQKRNHELESAAKGAQQTIVDLQHTVCNLRDALRGVNEDRDAIVAQNDAHKAHIIEQATMLEHYETQLDQVRKAIA